MSKIKQVSLDRQYIIQQDQYEDNGEIDSELSDEDEEKCNVDQLMTQNKFNIQRNEKPQILIQKDLVAGTNSEDIDSSELGNNSQNKIYQSVNQNKSSFQDSKHLQDTKNLYQKSKGKIMKSSPQISPKNINNSRAHIFIKQKKQVKTLKK